MLIAFEGLDQSGKETQARHLRARIEQAGRRVHSMSFPDYETALGQEIARALRGEQDFDPEVMQLLYIANRFEHRRQINLWLGAGDVVVCDRYSASSVAYGEAQGLNPEWLAQVQRDLPKPDMTVLLDIAPDTAARRKAAGRDRFERDRALLLRVRESYRRQASQPGWLLIDGERSHEEVRDAVERAVLPQLAPR
jgi:dTMP kinase